MEGRPKRVLVVDDESAMRLLARVNLPFAGFEVIEAKDADEALELAGRERFDLFLLDVMMPGMSGFDLARRLREEPSTADVPIVFLSARADQTDIREGLALGAADYITKPFDPMRLGDHLDAVLAGKARGRSRSLLGEDTA